MSSYDYLTLNNDKALKSMHKDLQSMKNEKIGSEYYMLGTGEFLDNLSKVSTMKDRLSQLKTFFDSRKDSFVKSISGASIGNANSVALMRNSLGLASTNGIEYPAYSIRGNMRGLTRGLYNIIDPKALNYLTKDPDISSNVNASVQSHIATHNRNLLDGYNIYNESQKQNDENKTTLEELKKLLGGGK